MILFAVDLTEPADVTSMVEHLAVRQGQLGLGQGRAAGNRIGLVVAIDPVDDRDRAVAGIDQRRTQAPALGVRVQRDLRGDETGGFLKQSNAGARRAQDEFPRGCAMPHTRIAALGRSSEQGKVVSADDAPVSVSPAACAPPDWPAQPAIRTSGSGPEIAFTRAVTRR